MNNYRIQISTSIDHADPMGLDTGMGRWLITRDYTVQAARLGDIAPFVDDMMDAVENIITQSIVSRVTDDD